MELRGLFVIRVAAAACVALVVLAACSSDPGGDTSADGEPVAAGTSVLENLTGDEMCALVSAATIEDRLGGVVEGHEGTERGRAPVMRSPYFLSRHCDYDTDQLPGLTTDLTTEWDEGTSDDEVLDGVFTDVIDESEPVGDYEALTDLGVTAGFGDDVLLAQAGVAGQKLGVVLRFGEERLLLTVSTTGRATSEQLRPLAEELVESLESAVGPGEN